MFRFTPSFSTARALVLASAFMASIPIGAQTFEPEAFDFGDVPVGTVTAPEVFVFTNTIALPLEVTGVLLTNPDAGFVITQTDCAGIVPPAGSCEVSVTFGPAQLGAAQTLMLLNTTSATGADDRFPVELSGNGVQPQGPAADLGLQLSLDDPSAASGQALTLSVQVENLGPDDAANVTLSLEFPAASAASAEASGAGWACALNASTLTCTRVALAALAQAPLTIEFDAPQAAGDYVVDGDVASETPDPVLANNSDQVVFGVGELPPPPPPPSQAMARQIPATGSLAAMLLIAGALLMAWRNRPG